MTGSPDRPIEWSYRTRLAVSPLEVRVCLRYLSTVGVLETFSYPAHRHAGYELIIPERGTYRCRVDALRVTVRPGQVAVIQAGSTHQDDLRPGQRYHALGLDLAWPGSARSLLLTAGVHLADVDLSPQVAELAHEMARCDAIAASRQDLLAGEMLWRVVRALPRDALHPAHGSDRERFLNDVERVFRHHAAGPLPAPAIARALGLSPTAAASAFRSHLGMSPARAFSRWRVTEARRMLAAGERSVAEVATHLGFANPYHFARVVRRHTGLPPSRLRGP